jgi:DNA-binding response OmpR family regulator
VGQFLSGNNEDFYRNNNASSADVIISQDARHHNNSGDKPQTRLLVVDDEPDIVHVLKLGLQQNGFLKSNAESYCLVLSDVRIPGLSGIQLAKRVKEINPNVKVVLMTAFEIRDNEFSKVFPSTRVDGFVQKPIGIRELTNKILNITGVSEEEK